MDSRPMKIRISHFYLLSALLFGVRAAGAQESRLIHYATTPGAEISRNFTLTVNGQDVLVEKFKDVSYARFAFSGSVQIEAKASSSFGYVTISPLNYGVNSAKIGNGVRFELDRPRKLILRFEGLDEKLFIFADAPEATTPRPGDRDVTNLADFIVERSGKTLQTKQLQAAIDTVSGKGGGILFVPNGKYLTGTFMVRKNVTFFLENGALIQGSDRLTDYHDNGNNKTGRPIEGKGALIYFDHADNARIMGRGVIAMAGTKIKNDTGQKIRICNMVECHNSGIYDVVLRDSGGFNIHILHSSDITMRGCKIINDLTLPNQDGTDPDGSNGVVVDDVFMYTSDDAIAVKADHRLCENVVVKNCVFWTLKSALKIGSDPYYGARNIVFENNDVVHSDRALALYAGEGFIEDVKYIDDKSEFVGGDAKRQLIVFQISNAKENNPENGRRGIGYIKNVEVTNYTAYQQSESPSLIVGAIAKDGTPHKVSNVAFTNLVIAGKRCLSFDDALILTARKGVSTLENVTFK